MKKKGMTEAQFKRWLAKRKDKWKMLCKRWLIFWALGLGSLQAGTISWTDPNVGAVGTVYTISNKVNSGPMTFYTNTISKTNFVPLFPGTNIFSVTVSNSSSTIPSDPAITNGIVPFKVISIIIEAKANLQGPGILLTNMEQLVAVKQDVTEFFVVGVNIK